MTTSRDCLTFPPDLGRAGSEKNGSCEAFDPIARQASLIWLKNYQASKEPCRIEYYLIRTDGKVAQVSRFEDRIVAAVAGPDGNLYLVSRKDAPRGKLLKLSLTDPDLAKARVIIPEGEAVLQIGGEFGGEPLVVTDKSLYVREIVGGPSRVARFDHDGKVDAGPSSVAEIAALSNGSLLYSIAI